MQFDKLFFSNICDSLCILFDVFPDSSLSNYIIMFVFVICNSVLPASKENANFQMEFNQPSKYAETSNLNMLLS